MTTTIVKCKTMEEIKNIASGLNMEEFYNRRKLLIWEESFAGQDAELLQVIQKPGRPNLYVIKSKYHITETVPKVWLVDAWETEEPFPYEPKDPVEFKRRMHPETPGTANVSAEDINKLQSQLAMLGMFGGGNIRKEGQDG